MNKIKKVNELNFSKQNRIDSDINDVDFVSDFEFEFYLLGTFEEFCEILTWGQLGFHQKPMGLLNVNGFYDPLLAMFDRAVTDGLRARRTGRWRWPTPDRQPAGADGGSIKPSRSANG